MNWSLNKQTRLKNGTTVHLSIEIQLGEDNFHYFPWTEEGFQAAFKMFMDNVKEIRSTDHEDHTMTIVADDGGDGHAEYITRKELSQKDYYTWYKFQTGKLYFSEYYSQTK